jgi:hypothetical protein
MLTFGAVGLSVWRAVVWPIRAARDAPAQNSIPATAAMARQIMMTRILARYRAEGFVFISNHAPFGAISPQNCLVGPTHDLQQMFHLAHEATLYEDLVKGIATKRRMNAMAGSVVGLGQNTTTNTTCKYLHGKESANL